MGEQLTASLNKLNIKSYFVPAHDMKAYCGYRSKSSLIVNLGTRWEWMSN